MRVCRHLLATHEHVSRGELENNLVVVVDVMELTEPAVAVWRLGFEFGLQCPLGLEGCLGRCLATVAESWMTRQFGGTTIDRANGGQPVGGVDSGVTERKIRSVLVQSQWEFHMSFICI